MRGSQTKSERLNILQIADHIIFVSEWCKRKFFEDLDKKDSYKCIVIYPFCKLSVNKIPKKKKIIFFSGKLNIYIGNSLETLEMREYQPGETVTIKPYTVHRMEAVEDCIYYETSTNELWDVIRLQDNYGRSDK